MLDQWEVLIWSMELNGAQNKPSYYHHHLDITIIIPQTNIRIYREGLLQNDEEKKILLFKPLNLWYFVTAALRTSVPCFHRSPLGTQNIDHGVDRDKS